MGRASAADEAVELFTSSEFSNGLVPVFEAAAAGVLRPSELLVVFETLIKINNYFRSINLDRPSLILNYSLMNLYLCHKEPTSSVSIPIAATIRMDTSNGVSRLYSSMKVLLERARKLSSILDLLFGKNRNGI